MQEKRISVRTGLLGVDATVSLNNGVDWYEIVAKDISDGGLSFTANVKIEQNAIILLKGTVSDVAKKVDISGKIQVMFAGTTQDGQLLYGVKFLGMSKGQHTTLSVFIEKMVTKFPPLLLQ